MTDIYSLYDLNEFIRQVLTLNFQEPMWLTAEIAQIDLSKGSCYINLIQKEADTERIIAQSNAIIWPSTLRRIKAKMGTLFHEILQEGMEVKVQAQVDFHERYGLKLIIEAIDPSYTFGQFAIKRQQTVQELQNLNLLNLNSRLSLPKVLQRLAVISSETAAGLQDYISQLNNNLYGYDFQNQLFPAAVQGIKVQEEIIKQLKKIALKRKDFDAVIIIRGGGSKLDLAAFDQLELCKAVAKFPLPVLVGIGHETDESVLDLVANRSLKTPTAVAEFLINHNAQFEGRLQQLFQAVQYYAQDYLHQSQLDLVQKEQFIQSASRQFVAVQRQQLDYMWKNTGKSAVVQLQQESTKLHFFNQICGLLSMKETIKRGFSVLYQNGKAIHDVNILDQEQIIENVLADGTIKSKIINISK